MASLVIRQFEVFPNPSSRSRKVIPFVVALQSHFLEALDTVIVAPLMRYPSDAKANEVMVEIELSDERLMLDLSSLANIERTLLKTARGDLLRHEYDICRALERLFTGF